MSLIPAILSGIPLVKQVIDRLFPDKKDERAEMRKIVVNSDEFKWFMRVTLILVVLEVVLKGAGWIWPQMGLPESILTNLEFYKFAAMLFAGLGG